MAWCRNLIFECQQPPCYGITLTTSIYMTQRHNKDLFLLTSSLSSLECIHLSVLLGFRQLENSIPGLGLFFLLMRILLLLHLFRDNAMANWICGSSSYTNFSLSPFSPSAEWLIKKGRKMEEQICRRTKEEGGSWSERRRFYNTMRRGALSWRTRNLCFAYAKGASTMYARKILRLLTNYKQAYKL